MQRQDDLVRAFVGLADTLVAGYDVIDLLQQLVDHAVDLLDISAAGLLLADSTGALRVAAASSENVRLMELFQLQADVGPCLECYQSGAAVVAGRPEELERRWAPFAERMGDEGFLSVAAVPLRLREQVIGVMGLFTARLDAPGGEDLHIAQGLADIATIGVLQARALHDSHVLSAQLQGALDSRVLIEQAKGVIAAQAATSVADAFLLIRSHARHHGEPLTRVAQAVVEGRLSADQLRPGPRRSDAPHPRGGAQP